MSRLIVLSNRLPVTFQVAEGKCNVLPSCGGLVTALRPLVSKRPSLWIGCPGDVREHDVQHALGELQDGTLTMQPVFLSETERRDYYVGFANEILWPLFHDLQSRCSFEPRYWEAYRSVNRKFADAVLRNARSGDQVWVHDYHLMLVAQYVRKARPDLSLSYFHHIPFPGPQIFNKLPARDEVLESMLRFESIGFQTARDRKNFIACARTRLAGIRVRRAGRDLELEWNHSRCRLGVFPISIDFDEFDVTGRSPQIAAESAFIRSAVREYMILGVDRLDYTKGVLERLRAFKRLLEENPQLRNHVVLVQVVVPSREEIPSYLEVKSATERLVSEINGEFGTAQWTPVKYLHRSLTRGQLIAHYRAADVLLVTPLKDGMNLVAKEFCAARSDEQGVLVLSEFAGAAAELKGGALIVNPCDVRQTSAAIQLALQMSESEQAERMRTMREHVKEFDVYRWFDRVGKAAKHELEACSPAMARKAGPQALAAAGD